MDTIGKRIEYFLGKEKIEVRDFADAIDLHVNSVYRMIAEDRGMNSTTLIKLINRYPQLNIDWLLTGNGHYLKNVTNHDSVNEEDAPYYKVNDNELKEKVMAILKNDVVLDVLVEILKKHGR